MAWPRLLANAREKLPLIPPIEADRIGKKKAPAL